MKQLLTLISLLLVWCVDLSAVEKFVLYTPPKTGSHLALKAIAKVTGHIEDRAPFGIVSTEQGLARANCSFLHQQFTWSHNWGPHLDALIADGFRIVVTLRDPRDTMLSFRDWILDGRARGNPLSAVRDPHELLDALIEGTRHGAKSIWSFEPYWTVIAQCPPCAVHILRFENLVGPEGGGSREQQINELMGLANFLAVPITEEQATEIANELFGGTLTFRHGQIGRWRREFTEEQQNQFVQLYSILLKETGYSER